MRCPCCQPFVRVDMLLRLHSAKLKRLSDALVANTKESKRLRLLASEATWLAGQSHAQWMKHGGR